jgi:hypothetical protein
MKTIDALLDQTPQSPLFHYTNANGLLGIMGHGKIWASSAYNLNDSGEFRYALSLISDHIRRYLKHVHGPDNRIFGEIQEGLPALARHVQAYVASFSEHGDLLSQWLAYSGTGNGYAVGFDDRHFAIAKQAGFTLVRCVYEEEEQQTLASAVTEILVEHLQEEDMAKLSKALAAAVAMKHPGFRQESEWRLVKTVAIGMGLSKEVLFRQGRNGVVPYLEAPLSAEPPLLPEAITIGPNTDMESASISLNTLLDSNGLFPILGHRRVKVAPSSTPYRS